MAHWPLKEKCDSGNWSSSSCADRLALAEFAGRCDDDGDDVDDDMEQESPLVPLAPLVPFINCVWISLRMPADHDLWSTVFK